MSTHVCAGTLSNLVCNKHNIMYMYNGGVDQPHRSETKLQYHHICTHFYGRHILAISMVQSKYANSMPVNT